MITVSYSKMWELGKKLSDTHQDITREENDDWSSFPFEYRLRVKSLLETHQLLTYFYNLQDLGARYAICFFYPFHKIRQKVYINYV